jgi:hypothetical protein
LGGGAIPVPKKNQDAHKRPENKNNKNAVINNGKKIRNKTENKHC